MNDKLLTVSSLDKVFPNEPPKVLQDKYSVLANEVFHFQVACFTKKALFDCKIKIKSKIEKYIKVRIVEPLPAYLSEKKGENDKYILKKKGGSTLYPELLRDIMEYGETARTNIWTAFWITVNADEEDIAPGVYDIEISLLYDGDTLFSKCNFCLTVIGAKLPKSDLEYTAWVHYDCIAKQHNASLFSADYYRALNEYIKSAVRHGMRMLYTPLFTPPLDTAVGFERQTAQLVDIVIKDDGSYCFSLDKLAFFVDNALSLGIEHFEFSHLATQWGAKFCPKVMAQKDGQDIKIFGWETKSDSVEYLAFLDSFLNELAKFIKYKRLDDKISFHISDEPGKDSMERFCKIRDIIVKHFPNPRIMDALTDIEFYEMGIINVPATATSHAQPFIKAGYLKWIYYCSWQKSNYLSNRFFNMPSQRNRILGMQLYASGAKGFLHWGFNFYNSILSKFPIDPYRNTDAGGGFESGDCFFVYPKAGGVDESLRHEVFYDGLNDYRALMLLEQLYGRSYVLALLKKQGISGFTKYKRSAVWHLKFRAKINSLIRKKTQENKIGEKVYAECKLD